MSKGNTRSLLTQFYLYIMHVFLISPMVIGLYHNNACYFYTEFIVSSLLLQDVIRLSLAFCGVGWISKIQSVVTSQSQGSSVHSIPFFDSSDNYDEMCISSVTDLTKIASSKLWNVFFYINEYEICGVFEHCYSILLECSSSLLSLLLNGEYTLLAYKSVLSAQFSSMMLLNAVKLFFYSGLEVESKLCAGLGMTN